MGTNKKRLMGALLASGAVVVGVSGTAAAQQNDAGNIVENTFTLDYSVGGTPQTGITNDPDAPGGRDVQGTETVFTVDRKVDLEVTALGGATTVAPGERGAATTFSLVNEGNDDFRYVLAASNRSPNTATIDANDADRNNFDYENTATYAWYVPADPAATCSGDAALYANATAQIDEDIAPNGKVCVRVITDVPAGTADTAQAGVYLNATAIQPLDWRNQGQPGTADAVTNAALSQDSDGNDISGVAENVFLDAAGPNDADNDAANSDQGFLLVSSAALTASKSVFAVATDGANCATATAPTFQAPGEYAVPGSCVVYLITVQNDGSDEARDIDLSDQLPAGVTFAGITRAGFVGGTLSPASGTTTCTENGAGRCQVTLANARLAGGSTEGTVTIRAIVD